MTNSSSLYPQITQIRVSICVNLWIKIDFVKQLQTMLGLTVDGTFGPETEATVRAFQRDHGLVPDGIVGPKTWAQLDTVK